MGTIVWKETKYSGTLLATLYHLQQENVMCDLQIKSRNLVIPVHTLILQAFSNTVDTHHSSEPVNVGDFVAKCSNFDSHIVSVFIQYLYTGEVIVEKHDLETFLKLCKDLNLENVVFGIQDECNRIEECLKRRSVPVTNTLSQKNAICSKPQNESTYDSVMNSFQIEVKKEPVETLDFGNSEMNNSASDHSIQPHETEKQSYENHMKFETDSVNLRMCPICNKLFEKEDEYAFHMESDHKLYSCSKCEFQDGERSNLNEHVRTKHSNLSKNGSDTKTDDKTMQIEGTSTSMKKSNDNAKEKKEFKCPFCKFKTFSRSSLSRHNKIHNNTMLVCDKCPSKFSTKSRLAYHIKAMHGEGIVCTHCGKVYGSREGLNAHLMKVRGDYKYECDTCHKTFISKSHLDGHMNSHRNYKPHKCTTCQKAFTYRCTLKKHQEACGNNTAPVDCPTCGLQLSSKDALKAHTKGKHGDTVYKCDVCGNVYRWAASFYRHIKTHSN